MKSLKIEESRNFPGAGTLQRGLTAFAVFFAIFRIAEAQSAVNPCVFKRGEQ